jgi:hypothetical protein
MSIKINGTNSVQTNNFAIPIAFVQTVHELHTLTADDSGPLHKDSNCSNGQGKYEISQILK